MCRYLVGRLRLSNTIGSFNFTAVNFHMSAKNVKIYSSEIKAAYGMTIIN